MPDLYSANVADEVPWLVWRAGTCGVILLAVGAKYNSYCATLARSLLIDSTKQQEQVSPRASVALPSLFSCQLLVGVISLKKGP